MKFDSFHPMIHFIYFVSTIAFCVLFDHPVFVLISWSLSFLYSVKLNGKKSLLLNLILVPLCGIYALYYAYYNHFGITNIQNNFIGNQITMEAVVYGLITGIRIASVIMWLSCVFTIVTSDKVVYLFGKISPKLSLFLSIILRSVPRIKERARRIELSRQGIGKGIRQGNILQRVLHTFTLISILITWTLEDFLESSASMKCRGYTLKGRTAFSIYRFDNRDRCYVILMFTCLTVIIMAVLLDQTTILYNPEIVMGKTTTLSYLFYGVYALFLIMPMGFQIYYERVMKGKRECLNRSLNK